MLVCNWIPIVHLVKMFAALIRPNHLYCCLMDMLDMLIKFKTLFTMLFTQTEHLSDH